MYSGLLEYLLYLIPLISVLGCLIGIYYYRNLIGKSKLILFYLFLCLVFDLISRILVFTQHNNLILVPIFGFLELLVFSMIYHKYMLKRKRMLVFSNVFVLLLVLLDCVFADPFQLSSFHSVGRIIDAFFILVLCLSYFYDLMIDQESSSRTKTTFNVITFLFFTLFVDD